MKKSCPLFLAASALVVLMTGCESIDTSVFGGSFGRNSTAMTAGGAVAGQDYVIGLKPSEAAQQYFASASASDAKTVTVTPGDDKGTGVTWTDDGGITIPPGVTIEFVNKGYCLDPHLPAPKADEEMQFIKTSCLIPTQLQGTYKNLLRRAAAGDEDVKSNLQHLMWTLRTAGSNDAYAKNLTDRQREILAECAEAGSFDGYCQDLHRFDELKKLVMAQVGQVTDKLQVEIGNVTYKVSDLLDPELGKQKVAAHLGELIHMNEYLPVVHSGFNFGELQKGIYTDIKGNGTLSYKAKVANSTSVPFVFYPMDYVAQVGSGQNMQGAFFAAADSSMKQRTTTGEQDKVDVKKDDRCTIAIKPYDLIGQRIELFYGSQEVPLPGGGVFSFGGGKVNVDVSDMYSFWGRFENGFGSVAPNAGAFSSTEDYGWFSFLWNNVYVNESTTMKELDHEGIHVLTKIDPQLRKYKGTKNEEYLAYIISGTGGNTPQEIKNHIDNDPVYNSKQWVAW